jgi:predicted dehydrogenase
MNDTTSRARSRRDFLKTSGQMAAAGTLLATAVPHVHAAQDNTIQLALIGCGGRGTGAAANALGVDNGPIKLVAMADVFPDRLKLSEAGLKRKFGDKMDVPEERKFVGFDAYKQAMDCLKPGDVAIFATPPAFRWVHFGYAIDKGLNVFMEKPVTVDGPTTRKMLELAKQADEKNLKVGVGLMIRHCQGRRELHQRIQDGEIGEVTAMRAYRHSSWNGCGPKPDDQTEVMHQIRRFHSLIWASGGVYSDFYIHQIDECSWMKGAWPISAAALGGRHYDDTGIDQNFDNYSVEYTYPDGTKLFYYGRNMRGCHMEFASYAMGTKGTAVISTSAHHPGKVRTYDGHVMVPEKLLWAFPQPEPSPYDLEWVDLINAIRQDQPYNEAARGAEASLVTSMGRMAAHTGQIITFDEILNSDHEMAPGVDTMTTDSPAPVVPGQDGVYPRPTPGRKPAGYRGDFREYYTPELG